MGMRVDRTRATLLAIVSLAAVLTACGKTTVKAESAEDSVVEVVSKQTGFTPDDVSCPDDVEAKEGNTFDCSFTGPDGPYTANVEIRQVDGEDVLFHIETRLTK
jgi:hypothetical protein